MDQNSVLQVVDDAVSTDVPETSPVNVLSQSSPDLLSPKDLGARGSEFNKKLAVLSGICSTCRHYS